MVLFYVVLGISCLQIGLVFSQDYGYQSSSYQQYQPDSYQSQGYSGSRGDYKGLYGSRSPYSDNYGYKGYYGSSGSYGNNRYGDYDGGRDYLTYDYNYGDSYGNRGRSSYDNYDNSYSYRRHHKRRTSTTTTTTTTPTTTTVTTTPVCPCSTVKGKVTYQLSGVATAASTGTVTFTNLQSAVVAVLAIQVGTISFIGTLAPGTYSVDVATNSQSYSATITVPPCQTKWLGTLAAS